MNLSSFQSQARAVTPDGKLTPELLRLLSAIVRDLKAVSEDQSLDVFAAEAGIDLSSEVLGYETVTQLATDAQDSLDIIMPPLESECCDPLMVFQPTQVAAAASELTGTTLAANVVNASLNSITPTGGRLTVNGSLKSTGSMFINTSTATNLWSGSATGINIEGTGSDTGKVTFKSANAQNITGEVAASYGSNVVAFLAKGDSVYPAMEFYQVNGGSYLLAMKFDSSGYLNFGSYVATPGAVTGYIEIKDNGGTLRKLAVI